MTELATYWQALKNSAQKMQTMNLHQLFVDNPHRAKQYTMTVDEIYWDYSKNFLNEEVIAQLIALAKAANLEEAIQHMMAGEAINTTEKRPALHTALRRAAASSLSVNNQDVMPAILTQKKKMAQMVERLTQQKWLGVKGDPITDVVNIGIGGSDLGPKLAAQALQSYAVSSLKMHFVSNIDPAVITGLLARLNPATTLFVISSKSFSTTETLTNAQVAKTWLQTHLGTEQVVNNHFIAVTAKPEKAKAWGVDAENILTFEEWVGGRYSVWSTIGFPVALQIGMDHFEAFLEGARTMDTHFATAPLKENMPVLLALIGLWYIQGWNAPTLAILPYDHGLRRLPDYLQQLDMESNGKRIQKNGERVTGDTGPIVWGQAGTNGQHAFYQLLHQGTHFIPADFIVAMQSNTNLHTQHQHFVAHCFAQAQAYMQGTQQETVDSVHEEMPGNKPSNMFVLNKMTPKALGELLALYEHKVFVQGIIWQINSFDQPGVELGKKLANEVIQSLESGVLSKKMDPSTCALIERMRATLG